MNSQNWNIGWRMVLMTTFTLLMWFATTVPVSGQCFTENDDKKCGMVGTNDDTTANGSIDFALALFKSVAQPPSLPQSGNCHISPVSVRFALIVTYLGTKGNTKVEMQTALQLGSYSQKQVLDQYRSLKSALTHNATATAKYTVKIADRIYFDNSLQLRKCMVGFLKPELEQLDFRSAPEPSRKLINSWVEDQTNKRIADLLPEGSIGSDTFMVIVNALYLKAAWARKFEPRATNDEDFFIEPQRSKKVSMMHQVAILPYASSSQLDCTAVEMAYSGNEISMVILLPNSSAADLISQLCTETLKDLFAKLNPVGVQLTMPKFKITQSFQLTDNLKTLGIRDLFDKSMADLSGFTGAKNAYVDSVHHKTFIEVNEYGTEAAAATAVGMRPTVVILAEVQFNLNRPFVFIIRNSKYNSVLFIGRIDDPTLQN